MTGAISTTYTAAWNDVNAHLKPAKPSLFNRIASPLIDHARRNTLIATWLISKEEEESNLATFRQYWSESAKDKVQEMYRMDETSVQPPDGAVLSAYCLRHRLAGPDTRTVLLFNPNGASSAEMPYHWLFEEMASRDTPCNFVTFNYRTVGTSTGELNRACDLCIDADAMMQFIESEFGTSRDKIVLYGWSLGGAVAAEAAAALQPASSAPIVLERTFSTSSKVAISGLTVLHRIGQFFLSLILRAIEWELDPSAATQKMLNQGRPVMVIHHPLDPIMKDAANLFEEIKENSALRSISLGTESALWVNAHVAPLKWFTTDEGTSVPSVIADFLLRG